MLEAEPAAFARTLRRLIQETEDHLASVRDPDRPRAGAGRGRLRGRPVPAQGARAPARTRRPGDHRRGGPVGDRRDRTGPPAGVVGGRAGGGVGRRPRHRFDDQRRPRRSAGSGRWALVGLVRARTPRATVGRPGRGPDHPGAGVVDVAGRRRCGARPRGRRRQRGVARPPRAGRPAPGGPWLGRLPCCGPVAAPTTARSTSRCAGSRRWSTRRRSTGWRPPCPAPSSPSHPPRRGRRPWPSSVRWSTPSSARPPDGSSCRRRRPRRTPPPPWPRR